MTHARRPVVLLAALLTLPVASRAQHAGVAATLHNLSVSGPGDIKAVSETEICKFCHIPHSATVPQGLWSRKLPPQGSYDVPTLSRGGALEPGPQPDGGSRLCLSCHDGTIALGDIARGSVSMATADRLERGRKGHLGTDLSGSHPVSVVVRATDPGRVSDMALKPAEAIISDGRVRLDGDGKVQCTSCHDPHSDRYYKPGEVPRFWVSATVDEVCLACHEVR